MDRPHKHTYVYVDGFNLFYGGLKGSRYKWLDLRKLLECAMPKNEIETIWYFTAMVKPSESDPSKDARQQSYVRALQTLEGIEIDYGFFRREERLMPRADGYGTLRVRFEKEKGSDVNLATRLLDDFYNDRFDSAAILTNDSDQAGPLRIINGRQSKPVGLVTPPRWSDSPAVALSREAAFRYRISMTMVRECQLPDTVLDADGRKIHRPDNW